MDNPVCEEEEKAPLFKRYETYDHDDNYNTPKYYIR